MSGCEFHVGQFDRACCNGKAQPEDLSGWIKLEGGTLDWGDGSPCAHTDDPCTKCGKELLPGFKEEFFRPLMILREESNDPSRNCDDTGDTTHLD